MRCFRRSSITIIDCTLILYILHPGYPFCLSLPPPLKVTDSPPLPPIGHLEAASSPHGA